MSSILQRLSRPGIAAWLLVGIPACSQEAPPTDAAAQAPADVQAPQVDAEEARKQELIARYAQQVATEEDHRRAEQGDADAQALLAVAYYNGRGVRVDYEEAVRWARLAADQENALGKNMLAAAYSDGRGVEQDYYEAVRWARPAAEANYPLSQITLGMMYLRGNGGLPRDLVSAYTWLSIASSHSGVAGGGMTLERVASRMTPDELEEAQARVRAWNP